MKFLYSHPRTKEALKAWSASSELVMASRFFWNSGSHMQNPQQNLLRNLLYQVLQHCPSLLKSLFSSRSGTIDCLADLEP